MILHHISQAWLAFSQYVITKSNLSLAPFSGICLIVSVYLNVTGCSQYTQAIPLHFHMFIIYLHVFLYTEQLLFFAFQFALFCQVILFFSWFDWLGLIVLLSWGSVGSVCVCEQSPRTSLLRGTLLQVHLSVGDGFVVEGLGIASF